MSVDATERASGRAREIMEAEPVDHLSELAGCIARLEEPELDVTQEDIAYAGLHALMAIAKAVERPSSR